MDTDNITASAGKKEYSPQRVTFAAIVGAMAAACVGPAVANILSLQTGQAWPQWTIFFLIIGGILFAVAILWLVPTSLWKVSARFLANIPRSLKVNSWLNSVLASNLKNVYQSVKLRYSLSAVSTDFAGMFNNPLDCYFVIQLEAINTSIFTMSITGVSGEMVIDGNGCKTPPKVNQLWNIEQGTPFTITITQQVVSDLMIKHIQEAAEKRDTVKLGLKSVYVSFGTTNAFYKGQITHLYLADIAVKANKV